MYFFFPHENYLVRLAWQCAGKLLPTMARCPYTPLTAVCVIFRTIPFYSGVCLIYRRAAHCYTMWTERFGAVSCRSLNWMVQMCAFCVVSGRFFHMRLTCKISNTIDVRTHTHAHHICSEWNVFSCCCFSCRWMNNVYSQIRNSELSAFCFFFDSGLLYGQPTGGDTIAEELINGSCWCRRNVNTW